MPMPPPRDTTEVTVVAPHRRGGTPGPETPPQGPPDPEGMELTILADAELLPTLVVAPRPALGEPQRIGTSEGSAPAPPPGLDLYDLIGEGGMGQVLLARDRVLRRRVAYKRLRSELRGEREIVLRLLAEAQITAQLDHPNVVPLYSLEREGTQPLGYVMKLVEGETLSALIRRARESVAAGRAPPQALGREALLEHFLKVCDAVTFAHAKGVIHRDLKPANIMVGRFNEVYVMDWGIARVLDLPDVLTSMGEERVRIGGNPPRSGGDAPAWDDSSGTPEYMSPEQAGGEVERLGPRSDLYSLGLILFELVCLRRAFGGGATAGVLDRVRRGKRSPIVAPSRALAVPPELRAIIEKATRPTPEDRYPDVAALARDLRSFMRGEPVSVLPETVLRRTLRWIGRHRQAVLSLFLATLLLAALATGALWYRHIQAMQEVRDRRELTLHYLSLVSARAHAVVERLTEILGHLEGLSAASQIALEIGTESDAPLYTSRDFDSPDAQPPGLAASPHYPGPPIDTEHPVVVLPPGGADPAALIKVRRLLALTPLLQGILLEANGEPLEEAVSGARVRESLGRETIAIHWLGVALHEGPLMGYPGFGGFPADYDATRRPWYLQALPEKGRRVCGEPYRDSVFPVLEMACSAALYSRSGALLGVAALELPLAGGVAQLLESPQLPQHRALLLNDRGEILLEVGEHGEETEDLLQPYGDGTIVEAARTGESGLQERTDGGRQLWVFYIYLPELGWTYVTELYAWGVKDAVPHGGRPTQPPLPQSREPGPAGGAPGDSG